MNKKRLLNFIKFLIASYKAGVTNVNIVKSLSESVTYRWMGKVLEHDILEKGLPLSVALRKNGLAPTHFTYLLESAEQSGKVLEILKSYSEILENQIRIDNELKIYKFYFAFVNILIVFGVLLFYFIFNNVVLKVVEDKSSKVFIFLQKIGDILTPANVFIFVFVGILFVILFSFRNILVDFFEYYVLGKPYREVIFSQVMNIWGNLISAGIPIQLSLFISVYTIENGYLKSLLNSYFSKVTNNYREINRDIVSKIFDVFPSDYRLVLKNSFATGVLDQELLEVSADLYDSSSKSLKAKVTLIMMLVISACLIVLAVLVVLSFMSIYLPLLEGIN
ncbi:MAG: type II secretion system F family protein [Candidatus Calescibacterium sp.]|nr:type II secretion system F family protein [Candidatus Calescibacterium sp.]MDW8133090.1 type II secretion system F family protein [Candidatus Calescibacterium sp.]